MSKDLLEHYWYNKLMDADRKNVVSHGCIKRMAQEIADDEADMIVMGVNPTYPSAKYGYVVPDGYATSERW